MDAEIAILNQRLMDRLGKELDGRPRYRIVWANDQIEVRIGVFDEFYGQLFIRQYRGAKEVPKYALPQMRDCWVLERLIYYPNPELPAASNGSYEPLHFFRDRNGEPYRPFWKAVEFLIYSILNPAKLTMSDYLEMERQAEEQEEKEFRELLDDAGRSKLFAFENTAVIDKTDMWDRSKEQ